jgi:hypothetical protein
VWIARFSGLIPAGWARFMGVGRPVLIRGRQKTAPPRAGLPAVVGAGGASLRLTPTVRRAADLVDILGVPYQVTTVRRCADHQDWALDVAIMLT